tara:strand:+ start:1079 stop:1774 length:696 start_codon:yes stop_codon:yes gene_type:complete
MKISLLCPTRKRPSFMKELWESAHSNAAFKEDIELIFYIDSDDSESIEMCKTLGTNVHAIIDERGDGNLSVMWNRCYEKSSADIVMHCGDDIRFRTLNWDKIVIDEFDKYDDKIVLIYGNDGIREDDLATHSFLHKNWVETVGYFLPPYFSSDMNDYWLTTVARNIKRLIKVNIYTEHLHPAVGKHELDITHQERIKRGARDNVRSLYDSKENERDIDCKKLLKFIEEYNG